MTAPISRSELEAQRFEEWRQAYIAGSELEPQRFEEWRQAYIADAAARGIRIPDPGEPVPEPVGADHDFEDE